MFPTGSAVRDRASERGGHRFDLAAFRRTDVLPVQGRTDMAIAVDEAEHAAFGVVGSACGEAGESFAVEACVVGFVDQNRVVTPDYSFFSDRFGKFSEYLDPLFDRGKDCARCLSRTGSA